MSPFLRAVMARLDAERRTQVDESRFRARFERDEPTAKRAPRDEGPPTVRTMAQRRERYYRRGRRVAAQMGDDATLEDAARALGLTVRQASYALRVFKGKQ